jgi:predicted dehydrogenase
MVAVCDAYKGRVKRAVQRTNGRAKVYANYHELLADPSILDAFKAGKDVYSEKPLTYTAKEGRDMISSRLSKSIA